MKKRWSAFNLLSSPLLPPPPLLSTPAAQFITIFIYVTVKDRTSTTGLRTLLTDFISKIKRMEKYPDLKI